MFLISWSCTTCIKVRASWIKRSLKMSLSSYQCKKCHHRLVHIRYHMNRCKSRLCSYIFHLWDHRGAMYQCIRSHLCKVNNLFTIISHNFSKSLEESVFFFNWQQLFKVPLAQGVWKRNGCVIMVCKWKQQTINNTFNNFYTEKIDLKKCRHPLLIINVKCLFKIKSLSLMKQCNLL